MVRRGPIADRRAESDSLATMSTGATPPTPIKVPKYFKRACGEFGAVRRDILSARVGFPNGG